MFDKSRAADYYLVAWCKNWTLREYLNVVLERQSMSAWLDQVDIDAAHAEMPWIPVNLGNYTGGRKVRAHVEDAYPKLSAWLHSRPDDLKRLGCARQIEKLKDSGAIKASTKPKYLDKYQAAMLGASVLAAKLNSHKRSNWNVCK